MAGLRKELRRCNLEEELSRYPLASYGEAFNFGHGGTREWLFHWLEEQRRSLLSKFDKMPFEELLKDPEFLRTHWTELGGGEKLRRARNKRQHSQKEAAAECGSVSHETYRKWEEGRTPLPRNISAIVRYLQTAG